MPSVYAETALKKGMKVVAKVKKCAPYPMKTRNGNVFPRRNSPIPAKIKSMPPNQIDAPTVACPDPPLPLQPINSAASGVNPVEKPMIASGVGLA